MKTMMFFILKVSVKSRLFDGIPINEIPIGWLLVVESWLKTFSTTCVMFWTWFAWKKIHSIVGMTVQVLVLNIIFSLGTERSKCFSSHNMFACFAPSTSTWSATAFFLFKRCYVRSHKNIFQLLALLNLIIGIFSRVFSCSLPGINNMCISDSTLVQVSKALDDK